MIDVDPRIPVLVGVGTCFDDVEAVELMARATLAAGQDAAAPGLLPRVERIVVPRGTWSYPDPARIVAERTGAADAVTVLVDVGIPQQTLIDEAMAAILTGDIDIAVVVGAEAKARSARIEASSTHADRAGIAHVFGRGGTREALATETDQGDVRPDVHQRPEGDLIDPAELAAGLFAPVEQYALIESALGAQEGRTPEQLRVEVAELQARFNLVARSNPEAAFPAPMTAEEIVDAGPSNRPLAFPYNKWHVSQWTVDQGAALLLCSASTAEKAGVPHDRWVFPQVGISSSHLVPLSQRRDLYRWPAMRVLGDAAEERIGNGLSDLDHLELYSCFPVAVRVQQRELALPLGGTPTITGGMTFAGGPFNSFVLQSTAAMAHRLRRAGGRGLVTSVSGLLTKPGLGIWSATSDGRPPLVADLADQAAAATATVEVRDTYDGPATVVASTLIYDGYEPREIIVIAETPQGQRTIARSETASLVGRAGTEGLIGESFQLASHRF